MPRKITQIAVVFRKAPISLFQSFGGDPRTHSNTLLMTIQPDIRARGPRGRNIDEGFEVGFEDLPDGRLTQINVEYFSYVDRILAVLVEHGLTPVLVSVFHGFGWKGLDPAGPVVSRGTALGRRSIS
jgi:hypothetical protein